MSIGNRQLEIGNLVMTWQDNLIDDDEGFRSLFSETKTIAVLGIKTEAQSGRPAFYVPQYLDRTGFQVVPVPVYYPEATHILGKPVFRTLKDIPFPIDLVNVFRRSQDVEPHLHDILEAGPKAVWMQSGIRHDVVAEKLAKAGIKVVQDRCIMVEHRFLARQ